MRSIVLAVFLLSAPAWAEEPLKLGVYKLKGSNPSDTKRKYEGKIVLAKEGANYRVTWLIGPSANQAQLGIAVLESNVLSIGYLDASGADFGVVSMKVINNKLLKGKWSSIFSDGGFGEEEFEFESESVPAKWKSAPPKKKDKKDFI